eukprot:1195187-Prorocentrum_minimum.AAC.1
MQMQSCSVREFRHLVWSFRVREGPRARHCRRPPSPGLVVQGKRGASCSALSSPTSPGLVVQGYVRSALQGVNPQSEEVNPQSKEVSPQSEEVSPQSEE